MRPAGRPIRSCSSWRIRPACGWLTRADAPESQHEAGGRGHFDFHPENVLVDPSGAVTGVVDWDGANRSNGVFDLFTLRFDLAYRAPDLGRWVDGLLREEADDELWLACWAPMSLRLVDWSLREIGPEAATIWLDVAEELRPE